MYQNSFNTRSMRWLLAVGSPTQLLQYRTSCNATHSPIYSTVCWTTLHINWHAAKPPLCELCEPVFVVGGYIYMYSHTLRRTHTHAHSLTHTLTHTHTNTHAITHIHTHTNTTHTHSHTPHTQTHSHTRYHSYTHSHTHHTHTHSVVAGDIEGTESLWLPQKPLRTDKEPFYPAHSDFVN